jgi:hypothetical protein
VVKSGETTACLVSGMCWYIEWVKLTSDLNTVQMHTGFVKDYCSYTVQ